MQPMGKGWMHNYNAYIVEETSGSTDYLYVVWPSGKIHQYDKFTRACTTPGVFDILTLDSNGRYYVKKKNQVSYEFARPSGGDVYYLSGIVDRNDNILDPSLITKSINGTNRYVTDYVRDSPNRRLYFYYDSAHRLTRVYDQTGNRNIYFTYDSKGRLITYKNPNGNTTTFIYGTSSAEQYLLKKIKSPRGHEVNVTYNANRKLSTLKLPSAASSYKFTHEPSYNSSTQTIHFKTEDLANSTTTNTYFDNNGHFKESRVGTTTTTINSRNDENQPTQITHGGKSSRMYYDDRGNITQMTTPEGINNYFTYNSINDITSVEDGKGYTTRYYYNSNDNLDKIADNLDFTTDYTINNKGQVTAIKNPENITSSFNYDSHGNQTRITSPLSIVTNKSYDNIGRMTRLTNPKSQVTDYEYDPHDLVKKVTRVSSGGDIRTQYGFDVNDNLTSISNAKGGITSMTYNEYDQLETQTFGNDTHQYEYDTDGKLDKYTKPSGTVLQHSYDNQGRIRNDGYATYYYDTRSNITNVLYNGNTTFTYDNDNRVKTINDIYSNVVNYTYDSNSNVTKLIYPGGFVVNYGYDKNNRMTSVSWAGGGTKTITYTYYKDGRLKRMNYPNGTYTTYGYDGAGRMVNIYNRKSDGTVISSHVYTLDKLGNHTQEVNEGPFSGPPTLATATQNGFYNEENELTTYSGSNTQWNADGNLEFHDGEISITFDKRNLLTRYSNHLYTYDGLGLLRQANRAGEVRKYTWDIRGMGNIIVEYNDSCAALYYYIHGLGLAVRIKASNTSDTHYYHSDFRGSIIAMTNATQNITHSYDYLPYGEIIRAEEADNDNRFTYIGKYGVMHEGGARYYMRARNYDALSGRFISEDPVWHDNLYDYASGNPITSLDPNGATVLNLACQTYLYEDNFDYTSPITHVENENYYYQVANFKNALKKINPIINPYNNLGLSPTGFAKDIHSCVTDITANGRKKSVNNSEGLTNNNTLQISTPDNLLDLLEDIEPTTINKEKVLPQIIDNSSSGKSTIAEALRLRNSNRKRGIIEALKTRNSKY